MIFAAIMAFAAAMDLLTMKIPNRISIALTAAFFVVAPVAGLAPLDILSHAGAGAIVLAGSFVLFALGGFGGGDAKLLSAAALWIGFDQLLPFLVSVTIFGGLLAIVILFYRKLPMPGILVPDWAMDLHRPGTGIPYGIAIASSALLVIPLSPWVIASLG
jgi:prepilin peptidase CpaA